MKNEVRTVDGISYTLIRKKIKNMYLRVKEEGKVVVTANMFVPAAQIDAFVRSNKEGVIKNIEKMKNRSVLQNIENNLVLWGKKYPLVFKQGSCRMDVQRDRIIVYFPNTDTDKIESYIRKELKKILEKQTKTFRARYDGIVNEYHCPLPEITYREMKTRWGSCLVNKAKITLNTRLVHYPMECLEYVIMHEYLHLIVPNHSVRFHALEDLYMPDNRKRQEILNKYQIQ